ncbi:MAG: aminoacetone oxidase family FAD-binding enzyme [Anaerolineaceae bacterium]
MRIAVIGAGAGGIVAAWAAARSHNHEIVLFERNERMGRKLLVTGSGRCNITNAAVSAERYVCTDQTWLTEFLEQFGVGELKQLFWSLGIPLKSTDDGWYYPYSESAQAVVGILEQRLLDSGVELRVATTVTHLKLSGQGGGSFEVTWHGVGGSTTEQFDRLVMASGGKAYPELGSKGELFGNLERMGHTVNPQIPALGPIYVRLGPFKHLQGLRFDVSAAVYEVEQCLGRTRGNVIVTEKGFNGPGVMDLSHLVGLYANHDLNLHVRFDFIDTPAFRSLAEQPGQTVLSLLEAYLPPKAAEWLIEHAWLKPEDLSSPDNLERLTHSAELTFPITGVGDFTRSQVTVGGVNVSEVSPHTCESRVVPGLFLVGETLDVAGPCGGFNLHFAFGSGYLAGAHLARSNKINKGE